MKQSEPQAFNQMQRPPAKLGIASPPKINGGSQ